MEKRKGRPIDNLNIDTEILKEWVKRDKSRWAIIKCQALLALAEGASVAHICEVLGITRESLRVWRKVFRTEGPKGFLSHKKTGRKTKRTPEIENKIKEMLGKPPAFFSMNGKKWTGKLIQEYLETHQKIKISHRTSLYWLKKSQTPF